MKTLANIIMSLVILATMAFSGFLGYVAFNQRERIVTLEKQVSELIADTQPEEEKKPIENGEKQNDAAE